MRFFLQSQITFGIQPSSTLLVRRKVSMDRCKNEIFVFDAFSYPLLGWRLHCAGQCCSIRYLLVSYFECRKPFCLHSRSMCTKASWRRILLRTMDIPDANVLFDDHRSATAWAALSHWPCFWTTDVEWRPLRYKWPRRFYFNKILRLHKSCSLFSTRICYLKPRFLQGCHFVTRARHPWRTWCRSAHIPECCKYLCWSASVNCIPALSKIFSYLEQLSLELSQCARCWFRTMCRSIFLSPGKYALSYLANLWHILPSASSSFPFPIFS